MAQAKKKTEPVAQADDAGTPSTFAALNETAAERPGRAPAVMSVGQLPADAEVAARTGPDAKIDGKFRHTFVLSGRDYDANRDNDDMHRANQVATLQFALNQGVHPVGEAALEGTEETADGSVRLTYAVEGIPAHDNEVPADAYTPAKAIRDMGGSTIETAQTTDEPAGR